MQIRQVSKSLVSLAVILLLLLNSTPAVQLPFVETLERIASDIRLRATVPGGIDDRIVIAAIDEQSLEALGHWPWTRDKIATLVDTLFDHYQVNVVGFDMVFAEADDSAGLQVLQSLDNSPVGQFDEYRQAAAGLKPQFAFDERFAQSISERNVVLGYVFDRSEDQTMNLLPEPMTEVDEAMSQQFPLFKPKGFTANLDILQSNAKDAGFFDNPNLDVDGQFRRAPILQAYKNGLYPSLALAVTRAALGDAKVDIQVQNGRDGYTAIEQVQLGSVLIPVDHTGSVPVPYRGGEGSFPYFSVADILNETVAVEDLEDRIVLIGTTAPGLLDLRATPVSSVYPGVEVHANIISGILDNRIPRQPAWVMALEMILLLILGTLMLIVPRWLTPRWIILLIAGVSGLVIAGNFWSWSQGLILPLASPLLMVLAMFLIHMTWGYLIEHRNKRSITKLFGHYVPPEVVSEMARQPDDVTLEGQAREMTVLFSDVRGFTSMSEGLEPKELSTLMNELLTPMTQAIHDNRGTIDKYMGDAIMAFWGAPLAHTDHAHAGIETAHSMIRGLFEMNKEFAGRGWPKIKLGVGVNTGTMNVGNMGSEFRMAYTVLGDAVNLGSRLEGLTKNYGVSIVVGETTRSAAPDFSFLELDRVRVKGRDEAVGIYEPLALSSEISEAENDFRIQFHKALVLYWAQQWDEAEAILRKLAAAAAAPDSVDWHGALYEVYLRRIEDYRRSPPGPNWDGVFTHQSK